MNTTRCSFLLPLIPLLLAPSLTEAHDLEKPFHTEAPAVGTELTVQWDSLYVTEGRDNLDGDSLLSASAVGSIGDFVLGAWYAGSPEDYTELNLWVEYGFEIAFAEFYVGYTHLRFPSDDETDNEFGTGVSIGDLPLGLSLGADVYYSLEAEGGFGELFLKREFEATEKLTIEPGLTLGFNDGYIADGHNGANHVALWVQTTWQIQENLSMSALLAQNLAIDSDPAQFTDDELLEDFFYAGIGVSLAF